MEEVKEILAEMKASNEQSLQHLDQSFTKIRAGKASPVMLSTVTVDYYGNQTPLSQVANVSTPDAMTISIQPWEKNMLQEIERAIINSNLGFAPNNNGDFIIITVPPMTEERRIEIAKQAKSEAEDAKVGIRNHRQDANKKIKALNGISEDMMKNAEADIQEMTDNYIKKVDDKLKAKEEDIMKV